jgi:hypothetical protein
VGRREETLFEREGPYAVRINDEFTVDVMRAACGHAWEELSRYVTTVTLDGVAIRLLSLQGLLLTKEGMRDKYRADAEVLRRAIARLQDP